MIPEKRIITGALKSLELAVHKQGWDEAPVLMSLHSYEGDEFKAMAAIPFPIQPNELGPDGGKALQFIGEIMRTEQDIPEFFTETMKHSFAGIAFVTEAWMSMVEPDERDGRMLADIPGSKEIRVAFAIDCAGRAYHVQRIRGERPTVEITEKGIAEDGAPRKLDGRVIIGLRDLAYGIARRLPLGSADLDAIAAIATEELEDGL